MRSFTIIAIIIAAFLSACAPEKKKEPAHVPGHETTIDSSLASILGRTDQRIVANAETIRAESGTRIFSLPVQGIVAYDSRAQKGIASRVAGRIEKLHIKYNYQRVSKGQLILEIYSPDLAAAQRELLFVKNNDADGELLQRARQKLLLLGMSEAQIQNLMKTQRVLYSVPVYSNASGYILERDATGFSAPVPAGTGVNNSADDGMGMGNASTPITSSSTSANSANSPVLLREGQYVTAGQTLFTIYDDSRLVAEFSFDSKVAREIKEGQKLLYRVQSNTDEFYSGSIGLIQPVFREGNNFTIAHVYITNGGLQPGQLLTANIPVSYNGNWLPTSAVVELGNRSVVFRKEGKVFIPTEVSTIARLDGRVLIDKDISDWHVAENAAFLVDSESFIQIDDSRKTSSQ